MPNTTFSNPQHGNNLILNPNELTDPEAGLSRRYFPESKNCKLSTSKALSLVPAWAIYFFLLINMIHVTNEAFLGKKSSSSTLDEKICAVLGLVVLFLSGGCLLKKSGCNLPNIGSFFIHTGRGARSSIGNGELRRIHEDSNSESSDSENSDSELISRSTARATPKS